MVQRLVANVYKLVVSLAALWGVEVADVEGADVVDVRVLLVESADANGDGLVGNPDDVASAVSVGLGPLVGYRALVRCDRRWGTVWSLDCDAGESVRCSFDCVARREGVVFEYAGVPAGGDDGRGSSEDGEVVQDVDLEVDVDVESNSVAVGGTFDHIHIGHKLLLTMVLYALDPLPMVYSSDQSTTTPTTTTTTTAADAAAAAAAAAATNDANASASASSITPPTRVVTIGVTAADLLKNKKYADVLQSWRTRMERTHAFISAIANFAPSSSSSPSTSPTLQETVEEIHDDGPNGHRVIVTWTIAPPSGETGGAGAGGAKVAGKIELRYTEIWDPFGPTITDPDVQTLVVSGETRAGGVGVNQRRVEKGWCPLRVVEVDVLDVAEEDEDGNGKEGSFDSKISSSEIRKRVLLGRSPMGGLVKGKV